MDQITLKETLIKAHQETLQPLRDEYASYQIGGISKQKAVPQRQTFRAFSVAVMLKTPITVRQLLLPEVGAWLHLIVNGIYLQWNMVLLSNKYPCI